MNAQVPSGEPTPARYRNPFTRYFAATRPPFLSAALVACLLGFASAHHSGIALSPLLACITMLLALLLHGAVNVLNDFYDARNGTDAGNTERVFPFTGGSRFIQNGVLSEDETAKFGYVLLATTMLGGLWLAGQSGSGLLLIGALGLFIGWAYSAGPFKLNTRGLGEPCVIAGFLGIVIGADYVQRAAFSMTPLLIGLPYALLVMNLLYINQFPDRKADAQAGKRNWVVRLPLTLAIQVYPLTLGLAFGLLMSLVHRGMLPAIALISALPLLPALYAAGILRRHAGQPAALLPAIRLTIVAMLAHGILLASSLVWDAA